MSKTTQNNPINHNNRWKKNQELKKMTYETHKPIEAKTNKERQEFKQSQHDYTIRSEWFTKEFDFWA